MFAITIAKDIRGDFVSHVAGCKDLTNRRRVQPGGNTYQGEDVLAAIKVADEAMAAWFGLTAYDKDAQETAWTFAHTSPAPCLTPALKGIVLDPETGEPSYKETQMPRTPELDHPYTPSRDAKAPRTMKVWIAVSIEVDLDAMNAEYGTSFNAAEARKEIKDSVPGVLFQTLYPEGSKIVLDVKETK